MTLTLIILSLPPKTFIGLDLLSFNSSPTFLGINKIPSGTHFLYTGTDASLSIRHGRWLNSSLRPETHVLRWNAGSETTDLVQPTDTTPESAIASASSGRGLVGYGDLHNAKLKLLARESEVEETQDDPSAPPAVEAPAESTEWPSLISHISPSLLNRLLSSDWLISSLSSAPNDTETIAGLSHLEASNVLNQLPLNLLPINLKHRPMQN